jgi:RNA polymerase sigma-70 factor (ECF subfamily)
LAALPKRGNLCPFAMTPPPPPNSEPAPSGAREFRTTHWSVVLRAGDSQSAGSAAALEQLCRAYWNPLYSFVRRSGHSPEDAQDLTQEFFARLLAGGALKTADPDQGRFRSFLLTMLTRMMASEWRHEHRQKRGGGAVVFSLDAQAAEDRYQFEPPDPVTPETIFERRWAETVLDRVLDRLEAEYRGHALGFENLQPYLVEDKGTAPFASAASRLGVSEAALKAVVYRLRCRYGEIFREEIAHTVGRPEEVEEEIRHLLAVLRGG